MTSSSNITTHRGRCLAPFLDESTFPSTGGYITGRMCIPLEELNVTCCIPCPYTDWTYADGFNQRTGIANWVNVAAMFATVFLLLSFVVLPVKWTHRHYLGVCLAIAVFSMEVAFVIPLAAKPDQCYNEITPNDMKSNLTCAFSGAFLMFGGWSVIIFVFCRALALHLQICWEVIAGKKFFYASLLAGWVIPAIGVTLTLSLTGVSYRFGNICHINHKYGLEDFWGPLMAFATLALVLQFTTIGYCIQVYVRSLLDDTTNTGTSSGAPTYQGSITTVSARQAYRRVKKVVQLQWRGGTIVLLIIAEVVFFSVVFVSMDNSSQVNEDLIRKAMPWVTCLALTGGKKAQCLPQAEGLVKKESVVIAVLICLGLSGFWLLLFLGRWSMVLGWIDLFKRKMINRQNEFVSADARRFSSDPRTYEMLDSTKSTPALNIQSPGRVLSPGQPNPLQSSPMTSEIESKQDYFGRQPHLRTYVASSVYTSPTPSTPAMFTPREWDHRQVRTSPNAAYPPGTAMSKDCI